MKTTFFTLCESAIIDQRTNALSIVNIIEEVNTIGLPAVFPKVTIVIVLERKTNEKDFDLDLVISQGKKKIFNKNTAIRFQGKLRTRHLIEMMGFTITDSENVKFEISKGKTKLGTLILKVVIAAGPKEAKEKTG
jgi:hypothetical protein